jgi:hypothetical protein
VEVRLTAQQAQEVGDLLTGAAGARYAKPHAYGESPVLRRDTPDGRS